MKQTIFPALMLSCIVCLTSVRLWALPVPTPPIPVPFPWPINVDKQPGDIIQCQAILSLQREHEITDRIFIGTDRAAPNCVLSNKMVPMASTWQQAQLYSVYKGGAESHAFRLDSAGQSGWMSECFITEEDSKVLTAAPPVIAKFMLDRQMFHRRCDGRAQIGTKSKYRFQIKLDRNIDHEERLLLGQWQGIPDLMKHYLGGKRHQGIWLREGTDFESKLSEGAVFDNGAFIPLTLEIKEGFLVLIARFDGDPLSDRDQCDIISVVSAKAGHKVKCDRHSQAVLIYKKPVEELFTNDQWVSFDLSVLWGKYNGLINVDGKLDFAVNGQPAPTWTGKLGRNDKIGPYMTLGAQLLGSGGALEVSYRNVNVDHHQIDYDVNLLKNPNNYGRFKSTWKVIEGRRNAFFHNRVRWAGWSDGFFGTPYYKVTRVQEIDLGTELAVRDNWKKYPPTIQAGEQFNKTYCGDDTYHLTVEVYDNQRNPIGKSEVGPNKVSGVCSWEASKWTKEKFTVNYKGVPRYIRFIDGGYDSESWAGYYGPRINEGFVILKKR